MSSKGSAKSSKSDSDSSSHSASKSQNTPPAQTQRIPVPQQSADRFAPSSIQKSPKSKASVDAGMRISRSARPGNSQNSIVHKPRNQSEQEHYKLLGDRVHVEAKHQDPNCLQYTLHWLK